MQFSFVFVSTHKISCLRNPIFLHPTVTCAPISYGIIIIVNIYFFIFRFVKAFFKVLLNTDGAMPLWQVADKQGSFPIPYHSEMETPMN